MNWLDASSPLCEVDLVEYDHLISVKKYDPDTMDLDKVINRDSKFVTKALADPNIKNLQKSTVI